MGELFYRNVADFIMNRRYRMCYEYVRWISFAATSNCPMVINLYTRQNRWSIGISSLSLFPLFLPFFWIRTLRLILRVSFSPVLFFFFSCFDYLPLLSRFNFNSFCSDYKANSIFHIQSIEGEEMGLKKVKEKEKSVVSIEPNQWRGSKYLLTSPRMLKSKSSTFTPSWNI